MTYPILRVRLDVMEENMNRITERMSKLGISVWAVTKGISAPLEVVRRIEKTDITAIADSRMANIRRMKDGGIEKPFALIRIPMRSELADVAELVDYTLMSDRETTELYAKVCAEKGKLRKVVIMTDLGDLREGFRISDFAEAIRTAKRVDGRGVTVAGVGTNFGCASGVLPTREKLESLVRFASELESALGHELEVISGGATTLSLLKPDGSLFPPGINNLRIGEGYLLGRDKSANRNIPWLSQATMQLEAELVEIRVKPSKPEGEVGFDAFGNVPSFEDRGERLRGILALGRQDVYPNSLFPLDDGVEVITASSDHLVVDLENCGGRFKVGDILRFRLGYPGMLAASTSPYVTKVYEG